MDWGAVLREASNPRSVDKDKGRWIIPSQYTGPEARQAAMQRKHGLFGMLWADIDSGNHSLETVYWAVKKLLGDAEFIIHSSHSHNGLDKLKWHVLTRTMHLIPGFAYTAAATVFIDRLRQLGLTVGNESRDISRLCYLPNPSIPSAYMWFHQPGEPFMWDEDFHNAAALIMAEERRTGEDSDNTGGAGLFEEKYPSAWMLEYLGMHRNGNHFHHPSQTNPTYATIAWPNRGWSTLSDTVAGIFGRKWGDSFDLFSSQIAPNAEYAKAARIALPYGWQIGQDPYEVLNFHKQQGEWLTYYGWCGPTPLGAGAQQLFLERSQERLAQIIEEPISVADGEWEIDWPPGIIGEVAQHIYSNSVKPVKQYSITMAFYLMAGLAGRRYTVYNMGLNLYIIMAGATGTGKGAARSVMRGLVAKIAAADQSPAINNVFAYEFPVSGPAIRKALGRGSPIIACFQEDADDVLTSLASSLGMGPGIKSALLSIWDQAGEEGVLGRIEHSKADDSSVAVQRPSFTFALDTQLAPYKRFMGSDVAQTTGFGSRIILIEYDGEIKPTNHNPRRDLSPNAMERLTSIWQSAYRSPNEFIAVQWSQEAHLLYLDSEEVNLKDADEREQVCRAAGGGRESPCSDYHGRAMVVGECLDDEKHQSRYSDGRRRRDRIGRNY
jgi:hypothetical protein